MNVFLFPHPLHWASYCFTVGLPCSHLQNHVVESSDWMLQLHTRLSATSKSPSKVQQKRFPIEGTEANSASESHVAVLREAGRKEIQLGADEYGSCLQHETETSPRSMELSSASNLPVSSWQRTPKTYFRFQLKIHSRFRHLAMSRARDKKSSESLGFEMKRLCFLQTFGIKRLRLLTLGRVQGAGG